MKNYEITVNHDVGLVNFFKGKIYSSYLPTNRHEEIAELLISSHKFELDKLVLSNGESVVFRPLWRVHRMNLLKLAEYLNQPVLKAEFDMSYYYSLDRNEGINESSFECGSIGCAVGHAPYAGIQKHSYESWNDYCIRQFGTRMWYLNCSNQNDYVDYLYFNFLFGDGWVKSNNTALGVVNRIVYFLNLMDHHEDQFELLSNGNPYSQEYGLYLNPYFKEQNNDLPLFAELRNHYLDK